MDLASYLKDHLPCALPPIAALGCAALLLAVLGVDAGAIVFTAVLALAGLAAAGIADYLRKRKFLNDLAQICDAIDKPTLASELLERPRFAEGALVYDAFAKATKSMNDRVAAAERASADYRDYVETWVHEVKTPIAAAHLVAANNPAAAIAQMDAEVARIEGYVEQALFYARGTALANDYLVRRTNLRGIVETALRRNAQTLIGAGVSPTLGDLDHEVLADEKWTVFVIGQVLVNAAKYTKPAPHGPARVQIGASRQERGMGAHVITLSISDNGVGIPASDIDRVFDKGFTGENGRRFAKSTGMGLYLVKTLCSKMGLEVSISSQEGAGTTVTICFPLDETRNPS